MAFTLSDFQRLRPFLYHLTARDNRAYICESRTLFPAEASLLASSKQALLDVKRKREEECLVRGHTIIIRDQGPLYAGNIELTHNWTFEDLVRQINRFVFFWPGTERGTISQGVNFCNRYRHEDPLLIRAPTADLLAASPDILPHFCKYNSGSPRCNNGRRSPRGADTFRPAGEVPYTPGAVVEVAFPGEVRIPGSALAKELSSTKWEPLLPPR